MITENSKYLYKLLRNVKASDTKDRIQKTTIKYSLTVQVIISLCKIVSKIKRQTIPSFNTYFLGTNDVAGTYSSTTADRPASKTDSTLLPSSNTHTLNAGR